MGCIGAAALSGGGVTHMAGGHLGVVGQFFQHTLGKNLTHQAQVAVAGQHAVHIQRDTAAFLAAVLQRVQRAVYGADHIGLAGFVIDAEDAAFFVQPFGILGKFTHSAFCSVISNQPSRRFMTSW